MNGCQWGHARISGWSLYQDRDLYYPFIVSSENSEDTVRGCLCTWEDEQIFASILLQCNSIEGYDPSSTHCANDLEIKNILV